MRRGVRRRLATICNRKVEAYYVRGKEVDPSEVLLPHNTKSLKGTWAEEEIAVFVMLKDAFGQVTAERFMEQVTGQLYLEKKGFTFCGTTLITEAELFGIVAEVQVVSGSGRIPF